METITIGKLAILTPYLDPRDLDSVTERPDTDLHEALVRDADWSEHQLVGARISQSRLIGVNLADAAWRNVTLYGCVLERVDLTGARLDNVTLERCHINGARLTGAHLLNSTVKNVIFDGCRFDYATLTTLRAAGPVAWRDTNLANTNLTGCRLPEAVFASCRLTETAFQDCDLRGADLTDNDISSVSGLTSLHGTILNSGQLLQLAAIAVRDLAIDLPEHNS